jgi:DNA-binding MarR family transcriptional regulator
MNLEQAIQMQSFKNDFQRAYLNIIFTANFLQSKMQQNLKRFDLTPPQFNVLRILRGQKGLPLCAVDIQDRMIHSTSNVTRIIERLLEKKLVTREYRPNNRRTLDVAITVKGLELINSVDCLAEEASDELAKVLTEEQAAQLGKWMDSIRNIPVE